MMAHDFPQGFGEAKSKVEYAGFTRKIDTGGELLNLGAGEYNPGDIKEIDRAIRHMPGVVAYLVQKAEELLEATDSENFGIILQNNPEYQRARAYVLPSNDQGVHEELSQHILLKAAIGMEGR
jgi:hypothetical protein